MKKKNPAVTAVLNFFLPGIGFTYLGSPIFIARASRSSHVPF